jgi:hypothetical protein
MRVETPSSCFSVGKRCNTCGRLMTNRSLRGEYCACGGSAWFVSLLTWPEKIALKFGWIRETVPAGLQKVTTPLGGSTELFSEVTRNGIEPA